MQSPRGWGPGRGQFPLAEEGGARIRPAGGNLPFSGDGKEAPGAQCQAGPQAGLPGHATWAPRVPVNVISVGFSSDSCWVIVFGLLNIFFLKAIPKWLRLLCF